MAEKDLGRLLRDLAPVLAGSDWGYITLPDGAATPQGIELFALIREAEGLTVIASWSALRAAGFDPWGPMARITLMVHSALEAVGLTAAVSAQLAAAGISANMIAGFHHDHILLPADRAGEALALLRALARDGAGERTNE